MIECKKCGTRNEDGAAFCGGCGSYLEFFGVRVADGNGSADAGAPVAVQANATPQASATAATTPATVAAPKEVGAAANEAVPVATPSPAPPRPGAIEGWLADSTQPTPTMTAPAPLAREAAPEKPGVVTEATDARPAGSRRGGPSRQFARTAGAVPDDATPAQASPVEAHPTEATSSVSTEPHAAPERTPLTPALNDRVEAAPTLAPPSVPSAVPAAPAPLPAEAPPIIGTPSTPPEAPAAESVSAAVAQPVAPQPVAPHPVAPHPVASLPVAARPIAVPGAEAFPATVPPARPPVVVPPARQPEAPPAEPASRPPTADVQRPVTRPAPAPAEPLVARPGDLICTKCATPNDPSRHFCLRCGTSLAAATTSRRRRWWHRFLPQPRHYEAGERLRTMDEPRPSEGARVLRALRNVVLALLGISVGVLVVGYATGMSFIRGPVDDLVYNVTGFIAKPVEVQGAAATASASSTGHGAANLLDGRLDYWSAPRSKLPITLTFTFTGPIDLTSINVIAHPRDNQVGLPSDVQIILPDGTTIDKTVADGLSGSPDQPSVTFDVHARAITTLKLLISSVEPATSPQVGIAEVRFYRRP